MNEKEALLKLVEMGRQEFEKGNYQSADDFFKEMDSNEKFSTQQGKENDLSNKQT